MSLGPSPRYYLASFLMAFACGHATNARDQTREEHEAAAATEEAHAREHEAEYDPDARARDEPVDCSKVPGIYDTCWSMVVNPTRRHLAEADDHRKRAAAHRRAANRVAAAENRACAHLRDYDRDLSPFFHSADIQSVTVGHDAVAVRFRDVPGLDRDKLQRIVDCHLARNAALESRESEADFCPLVPKGVAVRIGQDASGLTVEIHADDPGSAEELVARGHRLEARVKEDHLASEPQ